MNNNSFQLPPDKLNQLLAMAGQKLNMNPQQLQQQLQNGQLQNAMSNMNPAQSAMLNKVLNNPQEMEKVISNPKVQETINRLLQGNQGR